MKALVCTIVILVAALPLAGQDSSRVRAARDAVYAGRPYQTRMRSGVPGPPARATPGKEEGGPSRSGRNARGSTPSSRRMGPRSAPVPPPEPPGTGRDIGRFLTILFEVGLCVLAGLFIIWIVRSLMGYRPDDRTERQDGENAAAAPLPAQEGEQARLAAAERLAAEGRFSEALHVLLLLAIGRLDEVRGEVFPQATTSREILARAGLQDPARSELSGMVASVERSLFGGLATSREDYEEGVDSYRRFQTLCQLSST